MVVSPSSNALAAVSQSLGVLIMFLHLPSDFFVYITGRLTAPVPVALAHSVFVLMGFMQFPLVFSK